MVKMKASTDEKFKALGHSTHVSKISDKLGFPEIDGVKVEDLAEARAAQAGWLYETQDGSGLKEAAEVEWQHWWVTDGAGLLSGRAYIEAIKIRGNLAHTRSRGARGRPRKENIAL